MIKTARYRNSGGRNEFSEVVYAIFGNRCIFSGITPPHARTSTINAAESIIKVIAAQEHLSVWDLRFFDLQTHRGYTKRPGEFEFDELIIKAQNPEVDSEAYEMIYAEPLSPEQIESAVCLDETTDFTVSSWIATECPKEVVEIFREYIGEATDPALQVWKPGAARAKGYASTEMHSANAGTCFGYIRVATKARPGTLSMVVVDNEGHPALLKESGGRRYSVWGLSTVAYN